MVSPLGEVPIIIRGRLYGSQRTPRGGGTEATNADSSQEDRKLLKNQENLERKDGVSDGDRTRNHRSHSPELYH